MIYKRYILCFLASCLCVLYVHAESNISYSISFDSNKFIFGSNNINGVEYRTIAYDDFIYYGNPGEPMLPCKILIFAIPYNAKIIDVSSKDQSIVINNFGLLQPIQKEQKTYWEDDCNDELEEQWEDDLFTELDSMIYNSDVFYPENFSKILFDGYIYGDIRILKLVVYPALYNPISNILKIAQDLTLTINYDIDSNETLNLANESITRYNLEIRELESQKAKAAVLNPSNIDSYQTPIRPTSLLDTINNRSSIDFPTYNYTIITNRELEPSFKRIVGLKRQKGYSAGVVCVEDIVSSPLFMIGDYFENYSGCSITDSAGCVRQYLKYAFSSETNPAQYVLLGGKKPFCPIRISDYFSDQTDLYFSNLTCPWRTTPNSGIGEFKYNMPFNAFPELFVGRLLCKNGNEVYNYSKKLIKYTLGRDIPDFSYLIKGLFTQQDKMQSIYHEADTCASVMNTTLGFATSIIEEVSSSNPTGAQIMNNINSNKYGYLSFHNHGQPYALVVNNLDSANYRITVADRISGDGCIACGAFENGNGFDCLKNEKWPNVIYSIACNTMPYIYGGRLGVEYSIGQMLTLSKGFGAVSFLGNTGEGSIGTSSKMECEFIRQLVKYKKIGEAEGFSKFYANISSKHLILTHNLLGDPEAEMWTNIPQQYEGLTLNRYGSIFMIEGITPYDTIAYCDNEGNVARKYGSNGFDFFNFVSPSASIMVYSHNHIPYIFPLLLQNCNINNSQYVYASSFSAGRNVIPNNTQGVVTIKNGAVYEIDATDNVYLGEGFIVENGATFSVKTPGKVTIDRCVFQSGAKVKIEAGNVEFVGKFTAELGSKVEFKKFIDD